MRFIKTLAFLLCAVMFCSCLTSCGEDYKDAFIYIDFDTVPNCLDPQLADTDEELTVVRSLFDTLLRYDKEGKIVPSGAESVTKNGNTYIFKLKEDANWVDGAKVTAADYVFAFRRAVDPETKAPFANSLFSIVNAENINNGKAPLSALGVTAVDQYTLKIELEREDAEFEKVLTTAITMPCNEEYFTNCKGKYGLTLDTTPSNGSYYIRKWTTESKFLIRLAKNLDYNGNFEANSMRIYYTCGDDDAKTMLEHDNTDLVYVSTEEFSSVTAGGFKVLAVEDSCYTLFINEKIDKDIRQALLTSVSHNSLKSVLSGTQRNAKTIYPNVLSVSDLPNVDNNIKYDPEAAASIYSGKVLDGATLEGISITHPADDVSLSVAKAIAAHWQQTLSCFINIEESSTSSIAASYYGNYYDIIIIPFTAPTGTVSAYNSKLGYDLYDAAAVSNSLYSEYRCYPLFYSTTNIGSGYKIKNLDSSVHGGIIDVSMLIKEQ